jgi:hypothetical protein
MRLLLAALFVSVAAPAFAADSAATLDKQFHDTVQPFMGKYCAGCHSGKTPAGGLDFKSFDTLDSVTADFARWQTAANRIANGQMPPKPMAPPPPELANQIVQWVHGVRAEEIRRYDGDPGVVLARRLSNAEYDDTIRDLTGQDLRPAGQFPVDPANTAGFDNSGESLTMSPALLNKYLQAARSVADDMYLVPGGFEFAPHTMKVETDRLSWAIEQIIDFYKAQPTDTAKYFEASWRYRYRAQLGQPKATLASIAADMKLSPKYLPMVWGLLQEKGAIGPVAKLQGMFNALPEPGGNDAAIAAQTGAMRDWVQKIRFDTAMQFAAPKVKGLPGQAQPLHNYRLEEYAQNHRNSDPAALRADNEPAPKVLPVPKFPGLHSDATPRWLVIVNNSRAGDNDLVYPAGQKDKYQKAFTRFASVFPDAFYISERGRYWPDNSEDQGRLLSAGYHNTAGYYRDDTALRQLILDDKGSKALDRLWFNFDFYGDQTAFTWEQYYLNNAGQIDSRDAEAGLPRPATHKITDTAVIMDLRDRHLVKAKADPSNDVAEAVKAINWHFALKDATIRKVEKARLDAEPAQIAALTSFAARAWRRPLTAAEKADITSYYKSLRAKSQLSHEDAIRNSIADILMAPDFLYRFDLAGAKVAAASKGKAFTARPLANAELASRLSYFLWSSMPDAGLMAHAGDLGNPKVLIAQTRRMLKDDKVHGMATEFTGNWLGIRQFETNNSVDRDRFPTFDDALREAMFQEPIRFMQDNIVNERPVTDLLYGDYTFVNPVLARHYGMPPIVGNFNAWKRVDNASRYNRGGLLPMAVFMTQNSPGLRTSPVKRGAWLVEKVLGIRIPPPPPVVPELPSDEAKMDLSVRDTLAQHRANPLCASCHAKFDPLGLAFEGFGPVGETRAKDLGGRAVDTNFSFATDKGTFDGNGVSGLRDFIKANRQDEFIDNLSRKLLAYALGRSLQLSDEGLIDRMKVNLKNDDYRFRALVETIVLSPQFRDHRVEPLTTAQGAPAKDGLHKINFQKGAR